MLIAGESERYIFQRLFRNNKIGVYLKRKSSRIDFSITQEHEMTVKQKTANTSLPIKIVTCVILMMTVGFFIGSIFKSGLIIAGLLLGMISILCYFCAPVAYAISNNTLLVMSRINRKNSVQSQNASGSPDEFLVVFDFGELADCLLEQVFSGISPMVFLEPMSPVQEKTT